MRRTVMAGMSSILVVLALAASGSAVTQPGEHSRWRTPGPEREARRLLAILGDDRVKQMLNLTDDQAARLRQITVEVRKEAITRRADLAVRQLELRELLREDSPDRSAVLKKVQEISSLTAQLIQQQVEALLDAKAVLTPEQQKQIREFMATRRFGRASMRERGPGMAAEPGPGRMPMPPNQPSPPRPEPPVL